ncbi:flagellar assembly peptidoglycan hydrolase FlgJ [Lysobacter sp. GX 14042]|uniref:flagellar assembly peptidoglycan hydrolase FlgJ n=1 Tax=Lysobacter sp. GX 14042 TaxID=2907155 RepID=UPI001F2427B4|nr:flagellar assembly peptidoglycan hydrolase FlgJ [Lysobacter sp. GX 14042]MCE7031960.1 flagellar assembly peptidoglycan hydrolase FlgJ [Lysobacter sp. GX 14042]
MHLQSATAMSLQQPASATSPERVRTAARELESQFARMMIKSMRETGMGDAMFGGDTTYRDMYDQKLADQLTRGRGLGLAPMIEKQLGRSLQPKVDADAGGALPLPAAGRAGGAGFQLGAAAIDMPMASAGAMALPARNPMLMHKGLMQDLPMTEPVLSLAGTDSGVSIDAAAPLAAPALPVPPANRGPVKLDASSPEAFVKSIWPAACETAEELGVSPRALVAQAALETGWGRRLVGGADSHNLFGIKATGGWKGAKVASGTHEYYGGQRVDIRDNFRAYDSVQQSFDDYAKLMRSQRYAGALASGGDPAQFARALQKAGYATDPSYAAKISAIANGPTLRRALDALPGDGLPAGRMVAMRGGNGTRG